MTLCEDSPNLFLRNAPEYSGVRVALHLWRCVCRCGVQNSKGEDSQKTREMMQTHDLRIGDCCVTTAGEETENSANTHSASSYSNRVGNVLRPFDVDLAPWPRCSPSRNPVSVCHLQRRRPGAAC